MLTINNWTDVDHGLETIGLLELEISEISSRLGRKLYQLLGEHSKEVAEISGKLRSTKASIGNFCLLNKTEFAKKRSKQLNYGKISFRIAERIQVPEELEAAAIATLKKLGHTECVELRERLDKSALKKLPDSDLARCGIRRSKEDHFRIDPDLKLISKKNGARETASPTFSVDLRKLELAVRRNDEEEIVDPNAAGVGDAHEKD